ncbi:MAG: aconitate hydratase AcnA, partial [Planctomycetota bacterium]|nr:aconitate hydratase AcnA [Planctomycetota bacterium]
MTTTAIDNPFGTLGTLESKSGSLQFYRLKKLAESGVGEIEKLPFSIRVLLENLLRQTDGRNVREDDVASLANWDAACPAKTELPFMPARVLLQDFTGVPAVVDLAAMRSAMVRLGGDPKRINPLVPVDLVIDHSVQVDAFGSADALGINADMEFARNGERYEFLRWGQQTFSDFRVVPPATGIVHQVNLEYLAGVVVRRKIGGKMIAIPDSLVGTDSHTTMINGLGVLGWGVGGIEAEAVMLGQPVYMLTPEVVGFKLIGRLPEGTTATDLVLTITQKLRSRGVVGKFVEFFGDGLSELTLADRATIANMAPEYGATMGFFPVDAETLRYLKLTARDREDIDLVERYTKEQCLFRVDGAPEPEYTDRLLLELSTVEPSLAGPKRPQDRIRLSEMKDAFATALTAPVKERGFALSPEHVGRTATYRDNGNTCEVGHGAVVIAAITSCTNTSNPYVMVAAGLLARKAVERGLKVKPYVKTSLAPGSRVVTDYLDNADLTSDLEKLGFHTVGYGCTTCIGNSGPLSDKVDKIIKEGDLVVAAVLSGNRNYEGRISPSTRANYLASPPLVVAYALAGRVDINLKAEPLGKDLGGKSVFLADIWPTQGEIADVVGKSLSPAMFREQYANVLNGNKKWNRIETKKSDVYNWNAESTYIQEPPFFTDLPPKPAPLEPIAGARVLVMVGDSVTTDHISPAGSIATESPAGSFLQEHGVAPKDFNSYGSRRGNDRVMTRGTFANIRLRNQLVPGTEGGFTKYLPTGDPMTIYQAAMRYKQSKTPLIVLAGAEYGTGSSRDWAAKGTLLLGIRAVIAVSYERIHRSNLVGMGVLPLQFRKGDTRETLGLLGDEIFTIEGVNDDMRPGQEITVIAEDPEGKS